MSPDAPPVGRVVGRWPDAVARGVVWAVLAYSVWNFKVMSSLPRVLDPGRWWAPLVFPESLLLAGGAALLLATGRRRTPVPSRWLFRGSLALYLLGLLVSWLFNDVDLAYMVRVVVLHYLVPLGLFWLVLQSIESREELQISAVTVAASGLVLFLLATPVYLYSFAAFPPAGGLGWPASRILYNRAVFAAVHNDPAMLYDNVTFGALLNVSQLLIVLLPLAWAGLVGAERTRARALAGSAVAVFLLHVFFCYSRGAILVTLGYLIVATVGFWRHRLRTLVLALGLGFLLLTFGSPHVVPYWLAQLRFAEGTSSRARVGFVARPLAFEEYLPEGDKARYRLDERLRDAGFRRRLYWKIATTGLGYGNYGRLVGGIPETGTHNMFVNALVNAGPAGCLGLAGLSLWGLGNFWRGLRGATRARRREAERGLRLFLGAAFVGALALGVLSLYEFQYLGTSTGGILFWFLLAASAKLGHSEGASIRAAASPPQFSWGRSRRRGPDRGPSRPPPID